jgi:hypothetical protein
MSIVKKIFVASMLLIFNITTVLAQSTCASSDLSVQLPAFASVQAETSPTLTVHVTDKTGYLYTPIGARFKVVSNTADAQNLYLKATVRTQNGYEDAMFEQNGRIYIAFSSLRKIPSTQSLSNCRIGGTPNESPGIVAYPVDSVRGGLSARYLHGKSKYEIQVGNGTSYINVDIGRQVLLNSFGSNDPKGFYQATLTLTDIDN